MPQTYNLEPLSLAIVDGEADDALELVDQAIKAGVALDSIIEDALVEGMRIVSDKYDAKEYFVPDLAASADAMQECLDVITPLIDKNAKESKGVLVISTVEECSQEIGKNIVSAMLSGAGFTVYDLGTNTTSQEFVDKIKEVNADILAMGNPMLQTVKYLKDTTELLEKEGLRDKVKVLIGGACSNKDTVALVGADAYAKDGREAIAVCEAFMNQLKG